MYSGAIMSESCKSVSEPPSGTPITRHEHRCPTKYSTFFSVLHTFTISLATIERNEQSMPPGEPSVDGTHGMPAAMRYAANAS